MRVMRDLSVAAYVDLIRAEFRESPGLRLSRSQIQRLWRLDPSTCDAVLAALVDAQVLKRLGDTYARADVGDESLVARAIRRPRPPPRE